MQRKLIQTKLERIINSHGTNQCNKDQILANKTTLASPSVLSSQLQTNLPLPLALPYTLTSASNLNKLKYN